MSSRNFLQIKRQTMDVPRDLALLSKMRRRWIRAKGLRDVVGVYVIVGSLQ
mgnify:CR=1 FL=1